MDMKNKPQFIERRRHRDQLPQTIIDGNLFHLSNFHTDSLKKKPSEFNNQLKDNSETWKSQ